MKIVIPKVIVGVDMGEYAPELAGRMLQVWVNLPLDVLSEHLAMAARLNPAVINPHPALSLEGEGEGELLKWYAFVWSQGEIESHWTVDELKEIEQEDPAFLSWMIGATWEARKAHMDRKKKV
jgi:hypothetical protein